MKSEILNEQLKSIFENVKSTLIGILVLSFILAIFCYYYYTDEKIVFLWFGLMFAVSLIRYYDIKKYFNDPKPDFKYYYKRVLVFLTLTAIIFSSFIFLFPLDNTFLLIFFLILIVGISATTITAFSYLKLVINSYLIAIFLPPMVKFILSNEISYIMLATVMLLYLFIMFKLSDKTYEHYLKTIVLKQKYEKKNSLLNIQKQKLDHIFNNVPIGVFFYNQDMRLTDCNSFFADLCDSTKESLKNIKIDKIVSKDVCYVLEDIFQKTKRQYIGKLSRQRDIFVEIYTSFLEQEKDKIDGLSVVIDITELKKSQNKIEKLAYYDELTLLPKRDLIFKNIDSSIQRAKKDKIYSSLIYMDIDNFKDINDFSGHNTGDIFLQEIAKKFQEIMPKDSIVSRLSGDEFAMLLMGLSKDRDEVVKKSINIAEKILRTVEKPVNIDSNLIKTTVSIGILIIDEKVSDAYDVLKKADSAMYQVKKGVKNGILVYDNELEKEINQKYEIKNSLEIAINQKQFILYLQPQYNAYGKLISSEALLRWNHPTKGLIFPDQFLGIAEEFGYSFKITQQVIELAFQMLEGMQDKVKIAINLTGEDICNEEFYSYFKQMIAKYSHLKDFIEFEITEQSLINDIKSAVDIMKKISAEGICFSIDDFGTGYSSLSYLKDLPIDILKIDMSFVRNMFENKSDYIIVKTIIDMAKNLGLKTVAEGVESEKHFNELKKLGVDIFQGYYFSKPVPYEEFKNLKKFY